MGGIVSALDWSFFPSEDNEIFLALTLTNNTDTSDGGLIMSVFPVPDLNSCTGPVNVNNVVVSDPSVSAVI